jgi:hypothetical protein
MSRLTSTVDGVNVRISAIETADPSLATPGLRTIIALHANVEVSERTGHLHYPAALVYCDKLSNLLIEKFRKFSGRAHVVVDLRHSQDRLESIETNLQVYVDAVCALLDDSRGDWGSGVFYGGGYEVTYEPLGRGGKNFVQ